MRFVIVLLLIAFAAPLAGQDTLRGSGDSVSAKFLEEVVGPASRLPVRVLRLERDK